MYIRTNDLTTSMYPPQSQSLNYPKRQVEGAWNKDGRKPSIWDKFTHDGRAFKAEHGQDGTMLVGWQIMVDECIILFR